MSEKDIARQVEGAKEAAEAKSQARAGQSGKARRMTKRRVNFPFKVENGQLWRELEIDGPDGEPRKKWVPFGTEINVLARTRNHDGEDHGRLLEVIDGDGVPHIWAMPASLMAGETKALAGRLMDMGWEPLPGAGARWRARAFDSLLEYLLGADPKERVRSVSTVGWHGSTFVLPDETFGGSADGERVILQNGERIEHAFKVAGSVADWRETVAARAEGNSRLLLAISSAFAAPLLSLTGDDGGGFHFRGASSSGKSTTLVVAGSVWGGGEPRGYVQSWRATDNALEGLATLHNGALLCLDELSQVDSFSAGASAYMLGNGFGKARAGREGQTRKGAEWRLLFLSTGEMGLADKIKESGKRIAAGMEVRVIDLPADAGARMGLFEDIHGVDDPASFSKLLKDASGRSYGMPARAFLSRLVSDMSSARESVAELRRAFVDTVLPQEPDGQVRRVADRFALVAVAGELATRFGITGWSEGAAIEAAQRCFSDWLLERGGSGAGEVADAVERLRRVIEADGHSRFLPWWPDPRTVIRTNALGYVKRADETQPDVPPVYFFHGSGLKEILTGLDIKRIVEALGDMGILARHETAGSVALNKVYKVPYEKASKRLYEINLAALMGDAAASDGAGDE
jgi:putative DNA primase/helicase